MEGGASVGVGVVVGVAASEEVSSGVGVADTSGVKLPVGDVVSGLTVQAHNVKTNDITKTSDNSFFIFFSVQISYLSL